MNLSCQRLDFLLFWQIYSPYKVWYFRIFSVIYFLSMLKLEMSICLGFYFFFLLPKVTQFIYYWPKQVWNLKFCLLICFVGDDMQSTILVALFKTNKKRRQFVFLGLCLLVSIFYLCFAVVRLQNSAHYSNTKSTSFSHVRNNHS